MDNPPAARRFGEKLVNTVGIARFWHGARMLDETAFLF